MKALDVKKLALVSGGEQEIYMCDGSDGGGGSYMDVDWSPIEVDTSSISQLPEVNQAMPTVNVSGTISQAAQGFSTALGDCSNGATVGGAIGFFFEGVGAAPGAILGCLWGVGMGIIRDVGK